MTIYGKDYFGFVYIWFDMKKKRFYIGSHMGPIDDGYICSSNWMRNAYTKRPETFRRRIVYLHPTEERNGLLKEETRWLQMIKPEELRKRYYNKVRHSFGKESEELRSLAKKAWTPERKAKWSQKMREWREQNPVEAKKKLATCKQHSEETKAKISAGNEGKIMSDEARVKMSLSARGRSKQTSERNKRNHQEKKIGMHGKKHSEETRQRMSEAQLKRYRS